MWKLLPISPPGLCLQLLPLHCLLCRAVQQISPAFPHFSHTKSTTRKIPLLRTKVVLLKLPSSDASSNDVQIFISNLNIKIWQSPDSWIVRNLTHVWHKNFSMHSNLPQTEVQLQIFSNWKKNKGNILSLLIINIGYYYYYLSST